MNFAKWKDKNINAVIYECVAGSRAYGTDHISSDVDVRGIFIIPTKEYLKIIPIVDTVSDERGNIVCYSLQKFLLLASNANPNIIELLYMPNDCIRIISPLMEPILQNRNIFITKNAYYSHVKYAEAQIKKAKGQNKWVNNPQFSKKPQRENYCWVILNPKNKQVSFRPINLINSNIDLSKCHVASVEHGKGLYRLYEIGKSAKGVFQDGNIVCQSISIDEEKTKQIGLLIYNKEGYELAVRNHKNYCNWIHNRNEQRWISQEKKVIDYDTKNIMHTFRLLLSGENILKYGIPLVKFEGKSLEFLINILHGQFKYEELINLSYKKIEDLNALLKKSKLPKEPDYEKINSLLYDTTIQWEKMNDS